MSDTGISRDVNTTVHARRKELADLEQLANSKLPPISDSIEQFWVDIALSDGWQSSTLVVRPKPQKGASYLDSPRITTSKTCQKRPLIIHFYGGGFACGSPLQVSLAARYFAQQFDATVLCPSYRLVPEHPWPQGLKDGMDIVQQVSSNETYHYGADPAHGFIIGGVSAGAGVAAVIAGLTSNDAASYPLPRPLTGVFVSIALLIVDEIVPTEYKSLWTSREDNRHSESLSTASIEGLLVNLACTDYKSPWFSPVNLATSNDSGLTRHPPTYLQAGMLDSLRDDVVIYERILAKAGVKTKMHVFPNDGHSALTCFNVLFETKSKNPTIQEATMEGMQWLVEQVTVGA